MHDQKTNRRGILLMIGGSAFFSGNDAFSKLVLTGEGLPPSQMMALRGLIAALMLITLMAWRGELRSLRHVVDGRTMVRSWAEATGTYIFMTALAVMSIADAAAIVQIAPLLTVAAAVMLLGSKFGWQRWIAVAVGLVGVGLIIKPGASSFAPVAVLPVITAMLMTLRDFVTGRIGRHVPSLVVTFGTALCGMALGFAGAGFEEWKPLDLHTLLLILGGSCTLILGNGLTIAAFRGTDPAVIAPFRYAAVVCAVFLSATLFGMVPDLVSVAGMALIVAAGIYTVRDNGRPRLDPPRRAGAAEVESGAA
ncbi:DMT family transporter [Ancylobacter sonchi]|uniref:DMT family transporter n=1 Tax=Ancylobacter sonchi TaxID=1937790 RepID=UPI001BD47386|nr:DMT family transporter [Ancylobacter sonchi]MBS7535068.1 DMT family transporter [Ancylobacter sonchi]